MIDIAVVADKSQIPNSPEKKTTFVWASIRYKISGWKSYNPIDEKKEV